MADAGIGHQHNWRGRHHSGEVYSTDKPAQEPERALLAVGGEKRTQDRKLSGLRVWSEHYQQTLPVDCEALNWFARHMAEADHERESFDAGTSGHARDPQYLLGKPAEDYVMLDLAVKRARVKSRAAFEAALNEEKAEIITEQEQRRLSLT